MKLNPDFIVHKTESETILVPKGGTAFSGLGKGNATLGEILSLLEKGVSEEELIADLAGRYDAPRETIARDVRKILDDLRSIGALDE